MKPILQSAKAKTVYRFECVDKHGNVKWVEEVPNLIVNAGLDYIHNVALLSATQITAWYVGLTDGTPTIAAGDTLASHGGWVEVTAYSGNRKAWTGSDTGVGTGDNSASKASFAINADGTVIGGAFLASASSGTSGTLYGVAALAADRTADNGDTVNVTVSTSIAN